MFRVPVKFPCCLLESWTRSPRKRRKKSPSQRGTCRVWFLSICTPVYIPVNPFFRLSLFRWSFRPFIGSSVCRLFIRSLVCLLCFFLFVCRFSITLSSVCRLFIRQLAFICFFLFVCRFSVTLSFVHSSVGVYRFCSFVCRFSITLSSVCPLFLRLFAHVFTCLSSVRGSVIAETNCSRVASASFVTHPHPWFITASHACIVRAVPAAWTWTSGSTSPCRKAQKRSRTLRRYSLTRLPSTGGRLSYNDGNHSQEWSTSNFPLQPHQKFNVAQHEELGFSSLAQMKDDSTANSHYLTYTFLVKVGRVYVLNLGVKGLRIRSLEFAFMSKKFRSSFSANLLARLRSFHESITTTTFRRPLNTMGRWVLFCQSSNGFWFYSFDLQVAVTERAGNSRGGTGARKFHSTWSTEVRTLPRTAHSWVTGHQH